MPPLFGHIFVREATVGESVGTEPRGSFKHLHCWHYWFFDGVTSKSFCSMKSVGLIKWGLGVNKILGAD